MSSEIKPATAPTAPAPTAPSRRQRPLLVVVLGTALVLVTYVTPMASIASTSADLSSGASGRTWALSSMSVGLAAALLLSGTLGDAFGRRRVYLVGLVAMAVGALACAAAPSTGLLVAGRVLEGVGGAAVLACGLALLSATHAPGPERAHATAAWGASVGLGITLGVVVPVALEPLGGWRTTYAVTAVLALALVVPTLRLTPESSALEARRVDVAGLTLLTAALTALVAAATEARGGLSGLVIGLAVVALVLAVAFAVVEVRAAQPLVEVALLRSPGFAAATLAALATGLGIIGMSSNAAGVMQLGLGHPLWIAGAMIVIWSVMSVATSMTVRRHPLPWTGAQTLAIALLVTGLAQLVSLGGARLGSEWRITVSLGLAGLATGVLNAGLGREAVASVPPDRAAMGSGSNNTARYLGAALGITIFSVLAHVGQGGNADEVSAAWNSAVLYSAAASIVGALVVALSGRVWRPTAAP